MLGESCLLVNFYVYHNFQFSKWYNGTMVRLNESRRKLAFGLPSVSTIGKANGTLHHQVSRLAIVCLRGSSLPAVTQFLNKVVAQ